jgi:hypothetical protein
MTLVFSRAVVSPCLRNPLGTDPTEHQALIWGNGTSCKGRSRLRVSVRYHTVIPIPNETTAQFSISSPAPCALLAVAAGPSDECLCGKWSGCSKLPDWGMGARRGEKLASQPGRRPPFCCHHQAFFLASSEGRRRRDSRRGASAYLHLGGEHGRAAGGHLGSTDLADRGSCISIIGRGVASCAWSCAVVHWRGRASKRRAEKRGTGLGCVVVSVPLGIGRVLQQRRVIQVSCRLVCDIHCLEKVKGNEESADRQGGIRTHVEQAAISASYPALHLLLLSHGGGQPAE